MGARITFLDVLRPGKNKEFEVSTTNPLPVAVMSGGGGGGGGSLTPIIGENGTTRVTAANPLSVAQSIGGAPISTSNRLPVANLASSNSTPDYEKGAYVTTTDDIAQAAGAVSTNLAALDGVDFQSISVHVIVLSTYTGTLSFEVSNDGTNWSAKTLVREESGATNTLLSPVSAGVGANYMLSADVGARYFRVRQSAWTAGQVRVVATLSAFSTSTIPQQAMALLPGSQDIGAIGMRSAGESGSLAALSATAGGVTDCTVFGQVQVQVTGTFNATLLFQVSIDGTNWASKALIPSTMGTQTATVTGTGVWFGHIGARYFRVIANTYTSGTAVVTIRYNAAAGEMPLSTVTIAGGTVLGAVTAGHAGDEVTTTALAASATFTGANLDQGGTPLSYATRVRAEVQHTAGTVHGHIVLQQSPDGTTWRETQRSPVPSDGMVHSFEFTIHQRYYRMMFVNGTVAQTAFYLHHYRVGAEGQTADTRQDLQFALSTTALAASASFISPAFDLGGNHSWSVLRGLVRADSTGTMYIQQSKDGTNWYTTRCSDAGLGGTLSGNGVVTPADTGNMSFGEYKIVERYVRIKYDNGSTAQTTFDLNAALISA